MGKRAAAPKAKAPAKRSKASAAPPEPAPTSWGRPVPQTPGEREPLAVFLLDIEDGPSPSGDHELRLYGVTLQGHSVCAKIHNFHPYFYVRCGPEVAGHENEIQAALQAAVPPLGAGAQASSILAAARPHFGRARSMAFLPEGLSYLLSTTH